MLQQGTKNIIVTAPRLTTSEPVFKHAQQILPEAELSKGELSYQAGRLTFIAPDALLETNAADIGIDGAAVHAVQPGRPCDAGVRHVL